jgi:glycosyltransferase involved in cell wall biosynthesis
MLSLPRVSVVIPTYNREDTIETTLYSVFSQTYKNFDIIIVDDNSTDKTRQIIQKHADKLKFVLLNENGGGAKARNVGINESNAEFIAFLDSDDRWEPNHLQVSIDFLLENQIDGVFTNFKLLNESNNQLKPINFEIDKTILDQKYLANSLLGLKRVDCRTSTFLMKRQSLLQCFFDADLRKHQDWDLAIRFAGQFKLAYSCSSSVVIVHHTQATRMSNKLNLNASDLFINKHFNLLYPNTVYLFYLKMFYRAIKLKDQGSIDILKIKLNNIGSTVSIRYRILNYFILRANKIIFLLQKAKQIYNG